MEIMTLQMIHILISRKLNVLFVVKGQDLPIYIHRILVLIAFLLFVNGFFVAAEFALVKVRKTRLEQLCNEGNTNAKRALKLVNNTNKMLAAAQLGVTIASIALGWVAEATIVQLIEPVIKFIPLLILILRVG